MNAENYLDYLIDVATRYTKGDISVGILPTELKTLKVLFESEKAHSTLYPEFKRNQNGNPA